MKYLLIFIFPLLLISEGFEDYKKSFSSDFKSYKKELKDEFKAYKGEYKAYKKKIGVNWDKKEITTSKKWVKYDKKFRQKSVIDYKNRNIRFEVYAKNEKEARKKFLKLYSDIIDKNIKKAYEDDYIEQRIQKRKKVKSKPKSNQKLIILTNEEKLKFQKEIENNRFKMRKYKGKKIYSINLNLPKNYKIDLANNYKHLIEKYSKKYYIDKYLIYGIMETESNFNPMARSYAPAFGLMQIVPSTAGAETYEFLYGYKKRPSSSCLYDPQKNIEMGTAYLYIIYYKYLKKIKNPTTRIYCTISAYNAGIGHVAKVFIGNYNIKKAIKTINNYSPNEVYKALRVKLPKHENREYIKHVTKRMRTWKNLGI